MSHVDDIRLKTCECGAVTAYTATSLYQSIVFEGRKLCWPYVECRNCHKRMELK